jgi:hypothetical protein
MAGSAPVDQQRPALCLPKWPSWQVSYLPPLPGGFSLTSRGSNGRQSHRYRPGDNKLGRRSHGGRRSRRHSECGRRAHHALGRGIHQGRRAPGRPGGQAAGRDESAEHGLLDQAIHGAQDLRGHRGDQARSIQDRARSQRHGDRRGAGEAVYASRDLGDDPPEDEADRRGLPGQPGDESGRHGTRVLQRRAAPGHEGRRQDRGARRAPHHQ